MIKSIEGAIAWQVGLICAIVSCATLILGFAEGILQMIDMIFGNLIGALYGIITQTNPAGYDMTLLDPGYQTVQDLLGYLNTYLPFQSVINALVYIISTEAVLVLCRMVITVYKLIPLKAT